jgi:hypothetical protein
MERAPIFAFLTFQYFLHIGHQSFQDFRGHNITSVRTSGDNNTLSGLQGLNIIAVRTSGGTEYHTCQDFRGDRIPHLSELQGTQ